MVLVGYVGFEHGKPGFLKNQGSRLTDQCRAMAAVRVTLQGLNGELMLGPVEVPTTTRVKELKERLDAWMC